MIIQLKQGATKEQYNKITQDLIKKGYEIKDVSSDKVICIFVVINKIFTHWFLVYLVTVVACVLHNNYVAK